MWFALERVCHNTDRLTAKKFTERGRDGEVGGERCRKRGGEREKYMRDISENYA